MKFSRLTLLTLAVFMAGAWPAAAGSGGSGRSAHPSRDISQNPLEKHETQPATEAHQHRQGSPASAPAHAAADRPPDGDQNRLRDLEDELAREQSSARVKSGAPQVKQGRE